jgi:hypothetical protein
MLLYHFFLFILFPIFLLQPNIVRKLLFPFLHRKHPCPIIRARRLKTSSSSPMQDVRSSWNLLEDEPGHALLSKGKVLISFPDLWWSKRYMYGNLCLSIWKCRDDGIVGEVFNQSKNFHQHCASRKEPLYVYSWGTPYILSATVESTVYLLAKSKKPCSFFLVSSFEMSNNWDQYDKILLLFAWPFQFVLASWNAYACCSSQYRDYRHFSLWSP